MTTGKPAQGTNAERVLHDLLRSVGDQPPLTDEEKARLRETVRRRLRREL